MVTSVLLLTLLQGCFLTMSITMFINKRYLTRKFSNHKILSIRHGALLPYLSSCSSISSLCSHRKYTEVVLYDPNNQHSVEEIKQLKFHRPHLISYPLAIEKNSYTARVPSRIWTLLGSSTSSSSSSSLSALSSPSSFTASSSSSSSSSSPFIQVDCIELQDYYISGKNQLTLTETIDKWNHLIDDRLKAITTTQSDSDSMPVLASNEKYLSIELQHALQVVQTAAFMSRSLQNSLIGVRPQSTTQLQGVGISKDDNSPVTIADFAVQALIIDRLSSAFPDDKFIAEEDSAMLRLDSNHHICDQIIEALSAVTQEEWTIQRLLDTTDKGNYRNDDDVNTNSNSINDTNARVWVLDPVDGTKGFLRGQHYCIALALLINGQPQLSVLGCPNLDLQNVLQGNSNVTKISYVTPPLVVTTADHNSSVVLNIFPPSTGSLFYAVTNEGAYAKSLSMPSSAGFEVQVDDGGASGMSSGTSNNNNNNKNAIQQILLCESTEASHGNRDVTIGVYNTLQLKTEYLRLDGQCKYGVVGAGSAQGNLRLPPAGYQEKIWDHAPGAHFVIEAGGSVSDLQGKKIDFSLGRHLDKEITGIVASCGGKVQSELLRVVNQVKAQVEASDSFNKTRKFGQT